MSGEPHPFCGNYLLVISDIGYCIDRHRSLGRRFVCQLNGAVDRPQRVSAISRITVISRFSQKYLIILFIMALWLTIAIKPIRVQAVLENHLNFSLTKRNCNAWIRNTRDLAFSG